MLNRKPLKKLQVSRRNSRTWTEDDRIFQQYHRGRVGLHERLPVYVLSSKGHGFNKVIAFEGGPMAFAGFSKYMST